ncbi:hypothetical protein [uncultured Helicobacter sp.]|uniref:hypothetical protein n=1 Tax=uncultured Helicobacter sp. TaxID=175537 RepID=UPI00374EEC5C
MQVTCKIKADHLANMFWDRIQYWGNLSKEDMDLFYEMYERNIDDGLYEGAEIDINYIVDNDVTGCCSVLLKTDLSESDWNKLKRFYDDGERDVSCESFDYEIGIGFIEAMSEDRVLVRY